jgi:hypothetical protein
MTVVRSAAWQVVALLAFAVSMPAPVRGEVPPGKERPIIIATSVGIRMFHPDLELDDDFSFGGRVGVGLGRRWAVLLDFVACHPHRESTAIASYVDALRLLARANLITGRFRPYVVGGIGGVLFMFNDTPSTAGGALTAGLGADYRIAPQTSVFLEGSMDLYSHQEFTYDRDGSVAFVGPNRGKRLGTISGGIGVEF